MHIKHLVIISVSVTILILACSPIAPIATESRPLTTQRLLSPLARDDLSSVIEWVTYSVKYKEPSRLAPLIGQHGTGFAEFGTGVEFVGFDNSDLIVEELKKTLQDSEPICLGYNAVFGSRPDKAIIVFQGIDFDWPKLGLSGAQGSDTVAFQFFQFDESWEFVVITPILTEEALKMTAPLVQCPDV